MWLAQSRSRWFCFDIANNVVPVEDIFGMHNVDNTLSEAEIYNLMISCHCIAWDIKIRLDDLNEVKMVLPG